MPLRGSPGQCLLINEITEKTWFTFTDDNANNAHDGDFNVFPLYHIFGSEELSAHTPAIQARATTAYVALNQADAEQLGLQASDGVQLENNEAVPYIIRATIKPGTVGVSVGLNGLNFQNIGAAISLKKASHWHSPSHWKADNIIVSDRGAA